MDIPCGMSVFIGLPGCGKSTMASAFVQQFIKDKANKGRKAYSNVPILGSYQYDISDVGHFLMEDGLIIVDEAGIDYNNRNWKKNLDPEALEYNKKFRHYNISHYILFSQFLDFDNTFIRLAESLHVMRKLGSFTLIRDFRKTINFDENDQPIYGWKPVRFGFHFVRRSPYYKYFDSYEAKPLEYKEFKKWETVSRFIQFEEGYNPIWNERISKLLRYEGGYINA